jgi:hypothetical protein
MNLPRGRLVRQRVISDAGTALGTALDSELTGYARLESQDVLLLDGDGAGVLTFVEGIPVVAYHTGTDRGGPEALDDIAMAGPYRLELYELEVRALETVHGASELTVPAGMPAERLAADPGLANRTREAAPPERVGEPAGESGVDAPHAIEAFLENDDRIESIRERARREAKQRAAEWDI